jgi:hypothetical protein
MAEVHVTIKNIDASGNQVVFHNPGQHPLPASAGKSVTAATTSGPAAHGTVNNGSTNVAQVVFDNPA